MSLGNGQTHRDFQSSFEDFGCVACPEREVCFTLAWRGDDRMGENFWCQTLKDLGL